MRKEVKEIVKKINLIENNESISFRLKELFFLLFVFLIYFIFVFHRNAKCRENTIGSFKSAVQNGAHLIEFDVQLTNDKVPTVYHDFHVLLEVRNKLESPKRQMIFPFHKLNYEELKNFQVMPCFFNFFVFVSC